MKWTDITIGILVAVVALAAVRLAIVGSLTAGAVSASKGDG